MIFTRKRQVRLHLKDDRSLEGVLVHRGAVYVLRAATYLQDEESTVAAGEVGVPRENVSFFQVLS